MASGDRLLGLLSLLIGLGVVGAAMGIDVPGGTESLSPRFFPLLLAGALLVLGIVLLVRGGGVPLRKAGAALASRRSLAMAFLTGLYTLSFGFTDFRVGTALFMGCVMWVMGSRRPLELCLVPLGSSLLLYAVFRYGFLVLLPTWWE